MLDVTFNVSAFEKRAAEIGGALDQLPFALANAMTSAAFKARELLVTDTWPSHVQVRNRNFLRSALSVERATKRSLVVSITDKRIGGRGNLALHAKGGMKASRKRLAIPPTGTVRRTSKGVLASQKPKALIAKTPKRALRITPRGIFVGEGGRLHLRYAFKTTAQIRADVPFIEDFRRYMLNEMTNSFPASMAKAMKTRRAK